MSAAPQPGGSRLVGLVPMIHVADMRRSVEFYRQLGFEVAHKWESEGVLRWAHLKSGYADLMLSPTGRPLNPGAQDILFYLYAKDVVAYQAELKAKGLQVSEVTYPFYSPRGEFRIDEPDGYTLLVGHAD